MKYFALLFISLICLLPKETHGQNSCTAATNNTLRLNLKDPSLPNYISETGRLEICACLGGSSCRWSTVIASVSNGWSWKNIQVACRQLARDTGSAFVGLGNPVFQTLAPDQSILFPSSFECDGTETNLTDCLTRSIAVMDDSTNAYITCWKTVSTGHLRLTGSVSPHQGVLEMYLRHTGGWQTICSSNFDDAEARIACKTLGYGTGIISNTARTTGFRGNEINRNTAIHSVSCGGSERDMDSCFVSLRGSTACSTSRPAYVICTPNATSPGSTRLFTLQTFNDYKRVEVLYAGRWGTVCNTDWDITDTRITCSTLRLGVDEAQVPTSFDSIVASQRPLWASGFMCTGSESNLVSCNVSNPIGFAPNCNHTHDVGISCGEEEDGGGLSAGAIAGIVIGSLVACVCCSICTCIGCFFLCDHCNYHDFYGLKDCCDSSSDTSRSFRPTSFRRQRSIEPEIQLQRVGSPDSDAEKEEIPPEEPKEDAELSKPPPPSYNDALKMEANADPPPPGYVKEEPAQEEGEGGEGEGEGEGEGSTNNNPLPYPVIDSDPAYPPMILPTSTSTDV